MLSFCDICSQMDASEKRREPGLSLQESCGTWPTVQVIAREGS
jgi:hypothetical protein